MTHSSVSLYRNTSLNHTTDILAILKVAELKVWYISGLVLSGGDQCCVTRWTLERLTCLTVGPNSNSPASFSSRQIIGILGTASILPPRSTISA